MIAESVCQNDSVSADKYLDSWSLEEWWLVRGVVTDVLCTAVGKAWTKEQVTFILPDTHNLKEIRKLHDYLSFTIIT